MYVMKSENNVRVRVERPHEVMTCLSTCGYGIVPYRKEIDKVDETTFSREGLELHVPCMTLMLIPIESM